MQNSFIKLLVKTFLFFVFLILILQTNFVLLPNFIKSWLLVFLAIVFLLIFRFKNKQIFSKKFKSFLTVMTILLALINLILMILEKQYGFQYIQTHFNLSYSRFFYLVVFISALALYAHSFQLNKNKMKIIFFLLPLFLSLLALFIFLRSHQLFRVLIKDDYLVEYTQFFLMIFSALLSFFLHRAWWKKEIILGILFFFLAIGLFFMAGEEISWGQRLFNLETPEKIAERNLQGELTIHNIDSMFGLVYRAYMIIGFLGSTAWLFFKLIKQYFSERIKKIFSNLIPDWYLSPYFVIAFWYNFERFYLNPRGGEVEEVWEEPMELVLILGITLFLSVKFVRMYLKKIQKFC